MFAWEVYEDGDLFGVVYTFAEAGHGIGMHDHRGRDDHHNIIVLRGAVMVYGPDQSWRRHLKQGAIMAMDPKAHNPHEVLALEPGTQTLHLYTQGRPSAFKGRALEPEDMRGFTHMPPIFGASIS